ncbi:uncharacterized protein LOC131288083 isoform X2 [Anopheles ziemanni]|uniref:uncharacterized protein LOC131288083 isoform X2 n=1 Tax=Anopheles ziemanni TaxID=345580 RepID=UPI00265E5112|nr:uncharacterized protein LOC131288083 isoform X2 [Anopheles ziemanni]
MRIIFVYTFFMAVLSISGQWVFPDKLHTELSNSFNKNCGEMPYSVRNRPTFARMFENPWLVLLRHPEESLHFCHGMLQLAIDRQKSC